MVERGCGLSFVRKGTSAGGESCAKDRKGSGRAVEERSEALDIEGWERGVFVERVEEGIAGAKGELGKDRFGVGPSSISVLEC